MDWLYRPFFVCAVKFFAKFCFENENMAVFVRQLNASKGCNFLLADQDLMQHIYILQRQSTIYRRIFSMYNFFLLMYWSSTIPFIGVMCFRSFTIFYIECVAIYLVHTNFCQDLVADSIPFILDLDFAAACKRQRCQNFRYTCKKYKYSPVWLIC